MIVDDMTATKVPLLDLKAHHKDIREELVAAVTRVLDSGAYILSDEVTKLEQGVAAYCGARFAIGVSSGTDALLAALMALDLKPGDEVVTTAFSFFATAGTIARTGAKPVFVDIEPASFNISPKAIEKAITPKTKCIVPVHLYGQSADMDPILAIAKARGVAVVEDAAQAIGARYLGGKQAGTMGQLGCLSFFPTKNLGAAGDAGMVLTNDPALAEKVRMIRVHGSQPKYYHKLVGGNFRIDSLQAAILNVKLPRLDRWTEARRANAARYASLFEKKGLGSKVSLPKAVWAGKGLTFDHIYHQFVLRVADRDALREHLTKAGIASEVYYPLPLHLQECFKGLGYKPGSLPESERAAKETIALPIYPELTGDQQAAVVDAITAFY
ncbi:MAG: DegT/DnrJ/EryC1/StrS family aminotransferase [Elusimicrobia bacterium]|nr:DegT/DnrJ/EryC1/StrS family aminotransferase [Elusimicrobiota bacterium]